VPEPLSALPPPEPPGCGGPHLDVGDLADLASALLRVPARPGWPDPPFLVALPWGDPWRVDDLGFDLEARALLGGDDALRLLCHERPKPEWVAVGVVADGWTLPPAATDAVDWRTLRRDGPSLRLHPQRRRVRTLHLVGRGGPVALALLGDGDDEPEVHAVADGGADAGPTGPMPDALRRLFGLPTPPCPVPAVELWASLWLEAVAARAGRRRRATLAWEDVAGLHPGVQVLRRAGLDLHGVAAHLVFIGNVLARAKGWDALQTAAVTGAGIDGFLPPADLAAWADEGMFARLVLRQVEPLWSARRALRGRLSTATLARVDTTLAAWDLDPSPPAAVGRGGAGSPPPDHAA
jgi:hypothetical protein